MSRRRGGRGRGRGRNGHSLADVVVQLVPAHALRERERAPRLEPPHDAAALHDVRRRELHEALDVFLRAARSGQRGQRHGARTYSG